MKKLKELVLISQINHCFVIVGILKTLVKDTEYEQYACNGCHELSMMVYDLGDLMILNIKDVNYRCFVFNMSKADGIKLLNNSALDNKGIL